MNDQERMARPLSTVDLDIFDAIEKEADRQNTRLELIASENFTSQAVMDAAGSVFTNKYAEGYPGKRYYGGCEFADVVENLARERAKKLFRADYANVQPHSGSQANEAAYASVLQPGDTILGMNLAHGGHLTHGHPLNFSGKLYKVVAYGVRKDDELIDYEELARLAEENKPKMIIAGASAYSRVIDFARFRQIADAVGAVFLVDMAHYSGLIAAGVYPNPCEHADIVTSTTHKTLRGPRAGLILAKEKFGPAIDKAVFPGAQGGPLVHIIAAKAVCFLEAASEQFQAYQRQVVTNARRLSETLRGPRAGLILAKEKFGPAIDKAVFPGAQGGPLVHIIAAKAVCFLEAASEQFQAYQRQVVANARRLSETLRAEGFRVVSGGTDSHMMLIDVFAKGVKGKEAEKALDEAYITANKNAIPFDTNPPLNPSGIRLGSPAVTTRGFGEREMEEVGRLVAHVLHNVKSETAILEARKRVGELTSRFPLYAWKQRPALVNA